MKMFTIVSLVMFCLVSMHVQAQFSPRPYSQIEIKAQGDVAYHLLSYTALDGQSMVVQFTHPDGLSIDQVVQSMDRTRYPNNYSILSVVLSTRPVTRKGSKWIITYKEFDHIRNAVYRWGMGSTDPGVEAGITMK